MQRLRATGTVQVPAQSLLYGTFDVALTRVRGLSSVLVASAGIQLMTSATCMLSSKRKAQSGLKAWLPTYSV